MADNIKLTAEEIKELRKLITELNGAIDDVSFNNLINSGPAAKKVLSDLRKEYKDWTSDISDSQSQFQKLADQMKNTKSGVSEVNKVYKGLNSIAKDIQYHQKGITELNEKGAKNLQEQLQKRRQELSNASSLLDYEKEQLENQKSLNELDQLALHNEIKRLELKGRSGTLTKDEKQSLKEYRKEYQTLGDDIGKINSEIKKKTELQSEIKGIIDEEDANYKQIANTLKVITAQQKNLKNATGLTGAAVDGIGKAFNKIGLGGLSSAMGLDDAKEKMKEVAKEVTNGGDKAAGLNGKFKILGAGLKVIGSNMFKYLTDPLTIITGLVTGITAGIKGLISLFEQTAKFNGDIAKNFALSANESQKIGDNLRSAAGSDFFMTTEESRQAFDAMANAAGTINSKFSDPKTLSAMNDIVTYAGYTTEEAGKLNNLGELNNKSASEMITSLQGQLKVLQVNNKLRINEKQAVEMVAKASATVRMNLGQNPKKLAEAAFYASKLGMTLDEISSAAEQTLNFESAIQNQLEYQVLTGKEINIDAYQQAAASGDAAKAGEEMNRILEEQGDSIKGNFFAQEALAKTLGISREQLMKSLELQKIQKKVGGDIRDIEEAINRKMKDGLTFEQAAAAASEESYATMVEQNKNAQVFSKTISSIKESFMNALAGSEGFKNLFNPQNITKFVQFIEKELLPKAKEFGKIIGNLIDPKNIEKLVNKFNEIKDTLKIAGTVIAGIAALKLAQGIKNLIGGQRGSSPMNPLYVTSTGGGMGGGGFGSPGGGASLTSNILKGAGNLVGGKGTMVGRGLRNLSASVIKSNRAGGMMANVASKVLPKAASGVLGTVSKFAAPITSVAMTGKGLYDSLANEKLRGTGAGGFFEQLGGTGMHILDTMTFGATKFLSNKAGISIPGMDTDDVAAARAIFHKSGRDPDNSRTPMGLDNKQLIQDILANPSAYPEGIVEQAQNVNVEEIEDGRLNPNGGPVVSTFQKGELVPVMQGIKEDNVYMTTNKPVQQVQDGAYGSNVTVDNSPVIAAINKLTEAIMSNSSKEITLAINGQTVGKVLTPIMTPGIVREINNTSVLI